MINFNPELGFWTKFTFWYVFVNVIIMFLFNVVIVIGGIADLKYLLGSLKDEIVDDTDDGRVKNENEVEKRPS